MRGYQDAERVSAGYARWPQVSGGDSGSVSVGGDAPAQTLILRVGCADTLQNLTDEIIVSRAGS